jgi:amidohydrolase
MINITKEAKKIQKKIIEWRRDLHQIPEVGLILPRTEAYVQKRLREMDIEIKEFNRCSGIAGLIKGKKNINTIALRADMDALPIKEETGLAFASTNNNMHACGHDAHMAILLGAAQILKEHKDELLGSIKLIFQPGEEKMGGAKIMVEEGVLDEPKVDAILGLHVGNFIEDIKNGQIGVSYGVFMSSIDRFLVKIKGKGCHGATPHKGIDPITITAQVIIAFQLILSREIKATKPAVISIGRLSSGSSYNIIPDIVEFEGTVRTTDNDVRKKIPLRMKEIISCITKGMNGDFEFDYIFGYPPVANDLKVTKTFIETAKNIVGKENVIELSEPTMVGEDMSYYLEKVPGTYFFLRSVLKGEIYPHHNSKFNIDESILWKGAALLAQGAIDLLKKFKNLKQGR